MRRPASGIRPAATALWLRPPIFVVSTSRGPDPHRVESGFRPRPDFAAAPRPPASRDLAVVLPPTAPTRDRRVSSTIALLERHHSSCAPYYADCIADDDTNTAATVSADEFSFMMPAPYPHSEDADDCYTAHAPATGWRKTLLHYRVLEFSCSIVMILLAGVLALIGVHDRDIPNIEVRIDAKTTIWARDPTINQKKLLEQVPMILLVGVGTGAPIFVNLFMNYVLPKFKRVRVIPHDTRDFLLSMAQSVGISQVLTQFVKNMTGRFRPSFYDMCKWDYSVVWDGVTNLCRDKKWEKEGRKSFPSGHASYAWSTMFLLTLYLMGRSRLNTANRSESMLRGGRKSLKLFLCFLPTLVAAWVAVTRSIDNWHHYTDILAGSIIGALAAAFGYGYNYGSIFSWESAGVPFQEYHVQRKKRDRELLEASAGMLSGAGQTHDQSQTQSHSGIRTSSRSDVVINVK